MRGSVDYDTHLVDELPEQLPSAGPSPLEDQLDLIRTTVDYHAPLWARIARYSAAEHVAAAGAAANILRRRHGDDETVEGWRFETRRVDNGAASGLFAQYDPAAIVPCKAEENAVRYEQWRKRQADAAKQRSLKRKERQTEANGVTEGDSEDGDWEYESADAS